MTHIAGFIVKHKAFILILSTLLFIATAVCSFFVKVNYNSVEYLPDDSDTKKGLSVMYDAFGDNGTASVMAEDIDYATALQLKADIKAIEGVENILWLDDIFSSVSKQMSIALTQFGYTISSDDFTEYLLTYAGVLPSIDESDSRYPQYAGFLTILNQYGNALGMDSTKLASISVYAESFYKNSSALFQVTFTDTAYSKSAQNAVDGIKALDYDMYFTGNTAVVNDSVKTVTSQTNLALVIAVVVIMIILFAISGTYFEPVLFLITIGVAVVLNMGTNLILGDISYMTKSVASVLQLALTMDYSIFLLHRFKQEKEGGKAPDEAMIAALVRSFSPISASSLTTVCSFIAIMFMSYSIGLDLGIVLAKGVILSYITVFVLLPVMVVMSHRLIEKSAHKTFNLSLNRYSSFIIKSRKVLPILMLAIIIPCYFFQSWNSFSYGNEASVGSKGSEIYISKEMVAETFGSQNQLVVLIDKANFDKESDVSQMLSGFDYVEKISSYSLLEASGAANMLSADFIGQFRSANGEYSRILLTLNLPEESDDTTNAINEIKDKLNEQLGEGNYYIFGDAASALDIKNIVEKDFRLIMLISILLVGAVILLTFRSLLIPILLVFSIEAAVWFNMSVPYLIGEPMIFIGYLIVSSILLGATIDYAILLTSNYTVCRQTMRKFDAIRQSISMSAKAVLMSSLILTFAGFSISLISTMPAISVFGAAVGRGGITALLAVMVLLPQLLILFDKPIQKLTLKSGFMK